MEIFGDLERLFARLYPFRVPIAIGAALLLAAAAAGAYHFGVHRLMWRHKLATTVATAILLTVLVPTGYYLASPLWIRTSLVELEAAESSQRNQEAGIRAASETSPGQPIDPLSLRVTKRGDFVGADSFHFGRGRAVIGELAPGRYTLRVEEFSVQNGPDLYMYLSPSPTGYAPDAINLGRLKATDGAFSYDIPQGTDIPRVRSVIVWCRQFAVLFATATLS